MGVCIEQLRGSIRDLRNSFVEMCMLCASIGKGYETKVKRIPASHVINTDRISQTKRRELSRKKEQQQNARAWFVCMSHLENESNDFCSSPQVNILETPTLPVPPLFCGREARQGAAVRSIFTLLWCLHPQSTLCWHVIEHIMASISSDADKTYKSSTNLTYELFLFIYAK